MCKKNNSMDVSKCTDCFTSRAGKSSTADHFTHDGRRIDPTSFQHFLSGFHQAVQRRNVCKGCRDPTDKKWFCDDCVEAHERKSGKRFSGYCNTCKNCRVFTLNDDFCDDCIGYYKKPSEPASRGGKAATGGSGKGGGKGAEAVSGGIIRDCLRCHMFTRNVNLPHCTNCGGNLVLRR
jgi:rRNA maturation protein Nop10